MASATAPPPSHPVVRETVYWLGKNSLAVSRGEAPRRPKEPTPASILVLLGGSFARRRVLDICFDARLHLSLFPDTPQAIVKCCSNGLIMYKRVAFRISQTLLMKLKRQHSHGDITSNRRTNMLEEHSVLKTTLVTKWQFVKHTRRKHRTYVRVL